jgi:hypothetical protein
VPKHFILWPSKRASDSHTAGTSDADWLIGTPITAETSEFCSRRRIAASEAKRRDCGTAQALDGAVQKQ